MGSTLQAKLLHVLFKGNRAMSHSSAKTLASQRLGTVDGVHTCIYRARPHALLYLTALYKGSSALLSPLAKGQGTSFLVANNLVCVN